MKCLLYILIGLFGCFTANAQIITKQLLLKDSSKNIFYTGIENWIDIDNLPSDATVSLSRGTIEILGVNYYALVNDVGRDTLLVTRKGKIIFRKIFEVKTACDPYVRLAGIPDSSGSPEQILSYPRLILESPCDLKPNYYIISFITTLYVNKQFTISEKVNSSWIPSSVWEQIRKMHRGDKVILEDIKATCSSCRIRPFPPLVIHIQ
jgi:hypothetical protein